MKMTRWFRYLFAAAMAVCLFYGYASGQTTEKVHVLPPGGPPPKLADGHPDFSGVWFPNGAGVALNGAMNGALLTKFLGEDPVDPAARRQFDAKATPEEKPSFQPWATEKIKASQGVGRELNRLTVQCIPRGNPAMFLFDPYPFQFISTPGQVAILIELLNNFRIIHTSGQPHAKYPDPTFHGDSSAHWEGNTLVIDTVALDERTFIDGGTWFHSDQVHLTERISRPSMNYLVYQVTVDDPKVLTKPWTSAPRHWSLGHEDLQEYYCTNNQEIDELQKVQEKDSAGTGK